MKRILTLFFAVCVAGCFSVHAQVVNFKGYYHQDFDSLASTGTTASTMPYGWYFAETGTGANTTYGIDNGTSNSGNTFSYGSASSSDRALGSLASGSTQSVFGVAFKNNTGKSISTIKISYVVEQWRIGNTSTARMDSSVAELSFFATSLTSPGVWSAIPQLNLYSTVQTATTAAALDGNNRANRTLVSYTATGLSVPDGTTIWLRWTDPNITGSDDALAIDSFTLEIPKTTVSFISKTATVNEGDSVQISLSIANPNANNTSVKVDVMSNSTAKVTEDYIYSGASYTFNGGSSNNINFWVKTVDDVKVEKTETLRLMLMDPTNGAMLGDSIFILTILDNDTTQTYKIRDAKFPQTSGVPDTTKYGFYHGVVISPDLDGGSGFQFSLKDSTGAIAVANPVMNLGYTPKMGDSLIVRGKVSSLYYTTFILADSIWVKNANNTIPAATVTTTLTDNNESDLITVKNLKLTNKAQWKPVTGSGGFFVTATNGSKTFDIFIDEDTDLFNRTAPMFNFDITGIVMQIGFTPTTGYGIIPRFNADLMEITYPMYKIAQVKTVNANGIPDSLNKKVWIKGIVQSPTYRPNALEFSLQDSTAGIIVFRTPGNFGYTPNVGDSVQVLGTIVNFNGLTELTVAPVDTLIVLSTNGFPIEAKTITSYQEMYEGSLVKLENVSIINPAQWTGTGSGFNVDVTNGADTFQIRIDADVNLYSAAAPTGMFNVSGILTQFDNSAPHTTGYQLLPRSSADIELIVITEPTFMEYTIAQLKPYNATTGVADSIGTKAWIRGVVHSEDFGGAFFSLADNTAGIIVLADDIDYNAKRGDSIRVLGTVTQEDGTTQLMPDSIIVISSNNTLMSPLTLTGIATEANEGKLVAVNNVKYAGVDADDFDLFTKGTDTFMVFVAGGVNLPVFDTAASYNLGGILLQLDETAPYFSNYIIVPRDSFDIERLPNVSVKEASKNVLNFSIYPNPTTNIVNITSGFVADRIIITDVAGKEMLRNIPVTNAVRMDISDLNAGVYFIQVQKGGNISTQKLIRQ
ncbi:MAG: T9SS type A sorting domain-containing protein [Sphingobacteriales bacterium]|nr:MAG: T9SS type A sorting domain-containing protein [Sphingobacteriales bacterium]